MSRPDEAARRQYWRDQLEAATAFLGQCMDYPVAECGEPLVPLPEAAAAANVRVRFSGTPIVGDLPRIFCLREGLLAPFLAAPSSRLAREHPGLLTRDGSGEPVVSMFNDIWGGFVLGLDPTRPETRAHLEDLGRAVRAAGFDYAKLDFTFSPNVPGAYADPAATPAQRVRAGYDAFRRGFGDDGFILGCGAPLGSRSPPVMARQGVDPDQGGALILSGGVPGGRSHAMRGAAEEGSGWTC